MKKINLLFILLGFIGFMSISSCQGNFNKKNTNKDSTQNVSGAIDDVIQDEDTVGSGDSTDYQQSEDDLED